MEMRIRISTLMESKTSLLGSIEDRLLRIPQKIRESLGIKTGTFLTLKGINGQDIYLQIAGAYYDDVEIDGECLYVSATTHSLLDLKSISLLTPAADILIGCDPEFFLVDTNTDRLVSASSFFSYHGEVGSDCGLAELRPRPNLKATEVVKTIEALLKNAKQHIVGRSLMRDRNIRLFAASHRNNVSAGFHVHFGLPNALLKGNPDTPWLMAHMSSVLDFYVGILSIIPEGIEDSKRRSVKFGRYGKPGDHRHDLVTLEYRVPGGHLLRHPVLTTGLLSISSLVMKDMLSRIQSYSNEFKKPKIFASYVELKNLYPKLPDREEVIRVITSESTTSAQKHVEPIFEDIKKMIGFQDHTNIILPYLSYVVDCLNGKNKFNEDIITNWRL
jgi:hypothetical protein